MGLLRRILCSTTRIPAPDGEEQRETARSKSMETQTSAATAKLVDEVMKVERRSWEIRQALAANALDLVAGDKR